MNHLYPNIDYYLIGTSNAPNQFIPIDIMDLIQAHQVFSGGNRHYELIRHLLPSHHIWIAIKGKMTDVIQAYKAQKKPVVIFVSGDPFFYGFGNTLKKHVTTAAIRTYPYFNCIQLLCHRTQIDYSEVKTVSVHGRSWEKLDSALLSDYKLIGVLTDLSKSPTAIARRMLDHGFTNYQMIIGETLESVQEEVIFQSLEEAAETQFASLNCLLLVQTHKNRQPTGIADHHFTTLPRRQGMITKMPIRLTSIASLHLEKANTFWDVGSCTGSIAIEAKQRYPDLQVVAFEKRPECKDIIHTNKSRLSAPGIQIQIGDIFDTDLSGFTAPESIFIGGHGNKLGQMIQLLDKYLKPGGTLVINTVKENSKEIFKRTCRQLKYSLSKPIKISVDEFNPIHICSAVKRINES